MKELRSTDEYYMYLLVKDDRQIVERINVYNIDRGKLEGEIGYRIGENFTGKGFASEAVALISKEAKEKLGLNRLKALTLSFNAASSQVLKNNGFKEGETFEKYLLFNETMHDAKFFYKKLD